MVCSLKFATCLRVDGGQNNIVRKLLPKQAGDINCPQLTSKAARFPLSTARWTTVLLSQSTSSREAPPLMRLSKTLEPHNAAISSGVRPSLSLACTSACLPHRGREGEGGGGGGGGQLLLLLL